MKKRLTIIISTLAGIILVTGVIYFASKSTDNLIETTTPDSQLQSLSPQPESEQKDIRLPAVAGQFYPEESSELDTQLGDLLAKTEKLDAEGDLRILIAPHAGITYSGNTAAWGFKQTEGRNISKIILLGSSHRAAFDHAAIYPDGVWKTPLGSVEVDDTASSYLISQEQNIIADKASHLEEHSLELELIFLQKTLSDFKIIPILVSNPSDELIENLAQRMAYLFDNQTLLVVSTDLSHYPTLETANKVDRETTDSILTGEREIFEKTVKEIENQNYPNLSTGACGHQSVKVALRVAELLSFTNLKEIKYENSGDITGDSERVVGYASIGAWSHQLPSAKLDSDAQKEALEIARGTITEYLTNKKVPIVSPQNEALFRPLGAFVTLKRKEQLRGCLGVFEPSDPLYQVIQDRVIASATKDTRFLPVEASELSDIKIEISVLTPRQRVTSWQEIEIGKHGVVIQKGTRAGTFLPQVATDNNWGREKFLGELCSQKAGLPSNCYQDPSVQLYTFEAQIFEE